MALKKKTKKRKQLDRKKREDVALRSALASGKSKLDYSVSIVPPPQNHLYLAEPSSTEAKLPGTVHSRRKERNEVEQGKPNPSPMPESRKERRENRRQMCHPISVFYPDKMHPKKPREQKSVDKVHVPYQKKVVEKNEDGLYRKQGAVVIDRLNGPGCVRNVRDVDSPSKLRRKEKRMLAKEKRHAEKLRKAKEAA